MELANYIVGGGFLNSRLMTQIRQKEGLSYFVGSQFYASPLDQYGQFLGVAIYAPENAGKLQEAYSQVIDSVIRNGFSAEEVAKAKEGYLQSRQLSRSQDNELAPALTQDAFLGRTLAWDAALEARVRTLSPAAAAGGLPQVRRSLGIRDGQGGRFRQGQAGRVDTLI